MLLRLIAVGNKMPGWVSTGFDEYAKRLPLGFQLQLIEIHPEKRTKQADIARIMVKESDKILKALQPGSLVVALEVTGQAWTTEKLADNLRGWHEANRTVDLLVGGPDGLTPELIKRANVKWSLSALTLPHPLVRVVLAEQLYRAWSILQNHPYHR